MPRPLEYPIELFRNADYGETFYFSESGVALDFTGYTGAMELRYYPGAPDPALASATVDCTVGAGGIEAVIDWEDIDGLPEPSQRGKPAVFHYDLRLEAPDGTRELYLRGPATVFSEGTI